MDGALESPEARQARRQHITKRKRELEDELQVIQAQRQRLEHQLQSLNSCSRAGSWALQGPRP